MPNRDVFTDRVIIEDLTIMMSAGIYQHEKKDHQRVIFNIVLNVISNKGKVLKSIDDVVSYEAICHEVQNICAKKHYELLEELVEDIATQCLKFANVMSVDVKAQKPDIISETKSVGVQILRTN